MFDHLFENRNSTVTNLIKLGDCLGRSLRENVELFTVDSEEGKVAYLTESGKVISGEYDLASDVRLTSIKIQDIDIFTNNNTFDSFVNERVSTFVGSLNADAYGQADESFTDILDLWENRLKFENVKKRLDEKVDLFSESQRILDTDEFSRFLDVMPQFLNFLTENKEDISQIKEVENSIKLSNSVAQAFNFPKTTHQALEEETSYTIREGVNKSIYELVCKRELVAKELLESKKGFEEVWATNSKIRNLAGLIFENEEEVILESLVDAVLDVPYLALATKKQIFESLDNALGLAESDTISAKEIKSFASKLFEMKKPLKAVLTDVLNEKYGINVQNLKDTPTFENLANTQVVIFEVLSRLAPKGSIMKTSLSEVANLLKHKNGVEVIDVNNFLQEAFDACDYDSFCEEYTLIETVDFRDLLDLELSPAELLERAKGSTLLLDRDKNQRKTQKAMEKQEAAPESESDEEDDSVKAATDKKLTGKQSELDVDDDGDIEADDLKALRNKKKSGKKKKVKEDSEEEVDVVKEDSDESVGTEEEKSLSDDAFMKALKDLDELMQDLTSDEEAEQVDKAETDATEE
jgi:hypothetical protein